MRDRKVETDAAREPTGLSRREILRRGAIVGGTLLWVTPAIQSLAPKAFADREVGSFTACCQCLGSKRQSPSCTVEVITHDECFKRCGTRSLARYSVGRYACVDGNCVPVEQHSRRSSKPARAA